VKFVKEGQGPPLQALTKLTNKRDLAKNKGAAYCRALLHC